MDISLPGVGASDRPSSPPQADSTRGVKLAATPGLITSSPAMGMFFSFLLPGCPRTYRLSHSHLQRFSFRLEKEEVDSTGFFEAPCSLVPQKCGGLSQDTGLLERSLDHDKQWGAVQGHTMCGAGDGGLGSWAVGPHLAFVCMLSSALLPFCILRPLCCCDGPERWSKF